MRLVYQAIDSGGGSIRDILEASSIEEAADILRERGLFVTEIKPEDRLAAPKPRRVMGGKTARVRQIAMFSRQLQVMIATGTPLADALVALERQTRDPAFTAVITAMRQDVEQGTSLSEAMARHPACFDQVFRNIIEAGESSGTLDTMLDRLAKLTKKQAQTRSQLMGALVYPIVLVFISIVVMVIMLMLVLPRFSGLFASLDVPLPATTAVLMWASDLLRAYWWALLIILIGGGLGTHQWLKSTPGKQALDRAMITVPRVSLVTRTYASARIARLLGTLLDSKIPLIDALELTRHATGNHLYVNLMDRAHDIVIRGELVSSAFSDERLIDPALYEAIRNGEQSGKLGTLMLTIAEFLDEENEVRLKALTSLLEPLILVVLGVMVGGMAISMFMPLFDLTSMAGGGQ